MPDRLPDQPGVAALATGGPTLCADAALRRIPPDEALVAFATGSVRL